jgi:predicted transcriptional regulator
MPLKLRKGCEMGSRKGYKGVGRGILMDLLYRNGGLNQREIGELMGVDYSAVSVMRKRLSVLQKKDRNLSVRIESLRKRLESSQIQGFQPRSFTKKLALATIN